MRRSPFLCHSQAQVFRRFGIYWVRLMGEKYDRGLMKRGEAARRVIADGEDPLVMLLQVVWPDHDWAESAMLARLTGCPECSDDGRTCDVCGNTGLVTEERRNFLAIEDLAKLAYETP